jgi:hypothetical protein
MLIFVERISHDMRPSIHRYYLDCQGETPLARGVGGSAPDNHTSSSAAPGPT